MHNTLHPDAIQNLTGATGPYQSYQSLHWFRSKQPYLMAATIHPLARPHITCAFSRQGVDLRWSFKVPFSLLVAQDKPFKIYSRYN